MPTRCGRVMAAVIDRSPCSPSTTPRWSHPAISSGSNPLAGEVRLLIAARLGRARLIDNLGARI